MKVLWIGDAIVQSGFSVVTHNICNILYKKCDLVVYGIGYDGRVRNTYPYYIYNGRTDGDLYNFQRAASIAHYEDPDVIVIFNDDEIIRKYVDAGIQSLKAKVIPLFPINLLPLDRGNMFVFSDPKLDIAEIMTYTESSQREVLKICSDINVTAIYHGVDREKFFTVTNVKNKVGLKDFFVVGNVNSNTYRKRFDLFLKGFAIFAKDKPDVKCLLHCARDGAYNLREIVKALGIGDHVIFSEQILDISGMNHLYNMMNVNVNTSMGEGFGLSLIEGAACGVPVLCPEHDNLKDIWYQGADFIKIKEQEYLVNTGWKGSIIDVEDFVAQLTHFYENSGYTKTKGAQALELSKDSKFDWKTVSDKVFEVLCRASKNRTITLVNQI
jgi:D-inositol-3-phosphate glycosyltransferase